MGTLVTSVLLSAPVPLAAMLPAVTKKTIGSTVKQVPFGGRHDYLRTQAASTPRNAYGPLTFHPLWRKCAGATGRALSVPRVAEAGRGHPIRRVLEESVQQPKAVCGATSVLLWNCF